jgi:hypothetical protein
MEYKLQNYNIGGNEMLKTVIEKLIYRLNTHNRCLATANEMMVNEHEINMLLEILEDNNVKIFITAKNPAIGECRKFDVNHAQRMCSSWGAWRYVDIQFDFSKLSEINEPLIREMAYSEYKWDLRDGLMIFDLTKGF